MDYANVPLFSVMKAKMSYLSQKQEVLAQNIANADTPDYRAKDVVEPDFKRMAQGLQSASSHKLSMTTTHGAHTTGNTNSSVSYSMAQRDSTYELNPNGNNIVIEEEMMRVAENQAEYQKVLSLYRKTVDMFKTAIGRPN